jgi:hypothetical protein
MIYPWESSVVNIGYLESYPSTLGGMSFRAEGAAQPATVSRL